MTSPAFEVPGKPFRVVVTSTSGLLTTVVVWQAAGVAQLAPLPPDGTTPLTKLPAAVGLAAMPTSALAPGARPAGTVQTRVLPATGAQVTGAVGVTTMPARLAGKVSLRVRAAVVAPVPVLLAVKVHCTVSPTVAAVLSTLLLTPTRGLTTPRVSLSTLFAGTGSRVVLPAVVVIVRPPLAGRLKVALQLMREPGMKGETGALQLAVVPAGKPLMTQVGAAALSGPLFVHTPVTVMAAPAL